MESWAELYPPCAYDLGLLRFRQNKYVAAATQLRRAFAANFYIADILCGHPDPEPLSIWHGSNYAMPDLARDYVREYGKLWHDTGDALRTPPRVSPGQGIDTRLATAAVSSV